VPMGMAIWSATESAMLAFPARFFVEFFERHGFLNVSNRPTWQSIKGGSREYARKLTAPFVKRIRLNTAVVGVKRDATGVTVRSSTGTLERFDHVVFACHSDQALRMLEDPSAAELSVLGAFPYQENETVLHTDESVLPTLPLARAAWNYHRLDARDNRFRDRVALTYDMNILQSIDAPVRFLVTLNRTADIDPKRILRKFTYHHPVYLPAGVAAQKRRSEVSGLNRTCYCGAYWRYGFHEDGVVSAEWALEDFARMIGAGFESGGRALTV
jgi:predicted NAD/FAD-binding protein